MRWIGHKTVNWSVCALSITWGLVVLCFDLQTQNAPASPSQVKNPSRLLMARLGKLVVPSGGRDVSHEFEVENHSSETLSLRAVSKSCGCIALEPTHLSISPGASALVRLRTRLPFETGERRYTAWYEATGAEYQQLGVQLNVAALAAMSVEPREPLDIEVERGEEAVAEFSMTNSADSTEAVPTVVIETRPTGLAVVREGRVLTMNDGIRCITEALRIVLPLESDESASEEHRGTITVRSDRASVSRSFRWRRSSPVVVEPQRIFGETSAERNSSVCLKLSSGRVFHIRDVKSTLPFVHTKSTSISETLESAELVVEIGPFRTDKHATTGELAITVDCDGEFCLRVPVFLLNR